MKLGYIIGDNHPLFETINISDINKYKGIKPILIVGINYALQYSSNINLAKNEIDEYVYFIFSAEESEEYKNELDNYIKILFNKYTSHHCIAEVSKNPSNIKINSEYCFLYETNSVLTITTDDVIYYINKEIYYFFNSTPLNDIISKINHKILSWDNYIFFGAYLKTTNTYVSKEGIISLLKNYGDIELYMGVFCYNWFREIILSEINYKTLSLWNRAYYIENYLSSLKIKINEKKLNSLTEESEMFQSIKTSLISGYIKQKYNGTDKITGRMYVKDSDFSIQTLAKPYRDLVIAEQDCVLIEYDYDYFEYYLLYQILDIPLNGDPHLHMSNLVWRDDKHRNEAKTINYAIIYGSNISKVVDQLDIPDKEELEEKLREILEPLEPLKHSLYNQYKKCDYITNYFGRTIYPEKEHALLNNYIQSTAIDYFIIKLEKISELLPQYDGDNKIILQLHDSVLLNLNINTIETTDLIDVLHEILEGEEENIVAKISFKYGYDWKNIE